MPWPYHSIYWLGQNFESLRILNEALNHYQSSVTICNDLRVGLQFEDEWKISLRDVYQDAYTGLWRLLVKQGKVVEALVAAEEGRAFNVYGTFLPSSSKKKKCQ